MKAKINQKYLLLSPFLVLALLLLATPLATPATTSTQTTSSNVTVNTYMAIALTTDLAAGVQFGSLEQDTTDTASTTCASLACNVTVSADSNAAADLKIKDDVPLTKGGDTIPNTGYTWNASATVQPIVTGSTAITTSYAEFATNVAHDGTGLRVIQFWVDIPAGQNAGFYENVLSFCGEETGTSNCG